MTEPTKDPHRETGQTRQKASKNHTNIRQASNKAHVIALALHRDGFGVGHGVNAGVLLPRVIRPYTVKATRHG